MVENEMAPPCPNTFGDLTMYLNTGNGDCLFCPNCSGVSRWSSPGEYKGTPLGGLPSRGERGEVMRVASQDGIGAEKV